MREARGPVSSTSTAKLGLTFDPSLLLDRQRQTMGWLHKIGEELGFGHIARSHSRRDVSLLFFSRFIRMAG